MNHPTNKITGPHRGQPVLMAGEQLEQARAAMIMIHGRGASAQDILGLSAELPQAGFVYLAPQAANNTWYPNSFLAPLARNEPGLSSALSVISQLLESLTAAGITPERTILLGFSQGACLSLEYAARNAQRYGGVAGLSGGLIGPNDTDRNYPGSLADTPVLLGCSDRDPHIPKERVDASAKVLQGMGAQVTERIYHNMGHTVNDEEIELVNAMMKQLLEA
ncbi:phospholipase/carboxylesterase [Dictyobacter alpinus]|uniref:Phospholipase/carboxylesterase n=1 Tax=Dictyobacter alpinus TaxID=2014873 RepID=A0A402BGI9_9CHLR|nr:dienelactone hydrolase family protein [Dictyobacter alpinus]GCE30521.1 phospholipase/carboxylesterase [Dictyobacter alpinus]